MPKNKRSRDQVETYESDGGFISNDDGNAPKSKKSKKAGTSKPNTSGDDQHWAVRCPLVSPISISPSNEPSQLSSGRTPRRVNISEYKNSKLVNIREYYEKDDDYLPGKKVRVMRGRGLQGGRLMGGG
jgi:hypothetical protein